MARGNNKRNRAAKLAISCIVFFVVAILSVQIVRLYEKNKQYQAMELALEEEKEREEQRSKQLEEYEIYISTQEYIEDAAQSKLGLVYDDAIIFKEIQ